MKTIEMADASASLRDYARDGEPLVVTVEGRPVAFFAPLGPETDLENLIVSAHPGFRRLIARSRRLHPPGTGASSAEVRRRLKATSRRARGRR